MKLQVHCFRRFLVAGFILVLVFGFNVALLAQEKKEQEVKEDQVWAEKGLKYVEKKDYPSALECFQKALNLNPGEIHYPINLSQIYCKMEKFPEALQVLDDALKKFSDKEKQKEIQIARADIHFSWADKLRKDYQYLPAISHLEDAYQIDKYLRPKNTSVYLNNIGFLYNALGEKKKALVYCEKASSIFFSLGNWAGEATTLNNIGMVYSSIGDKKKALEYYEKALSFFSILNDRDGEAVTLASIGEVYASIGSRKQSLGFYNKALSLFSTLGDRAGEATTLANVGTVYYDFGEQEKALEYYNKALSIFSVLVDRVGEASTLSGIGSVYSALGEKEKALDFFNKALSFFSAIGDLARETSILNNIAGVYYDFGEKEKALEYNKIALQLSRIVGDRAGEATTLNNIANVYSTLGEKEKAIEYFEGALQLHHAAGDRSAEAIIFNNIGTVYYGLDKNEKALENFEISLPLCRAVGDRAGEATTLSNLMALWDRLNNKPMAIFYGKQSVNGLQQLRENIVNLNKDTKSIYLKTKKEFYRYLINLLIMRHRLDEALLVLDMLKAEEYYQFIKKDSPFSFPDRQYKPLEFTPFEQQWLDKLNAILANFTTVSNQYQDLLMSKPKTEAEQTRLAELKKQLDEANKAYEKYCVDLKAAFDEHDKIIQKGEKDGLNLAARPDSIQSTLRNLDEKEEGKNVSLHYFVYENKIHIILTTPNRQILQSSILDEKALIFMIEKFQVTINRRKPHSISVIKNPFDKTIIPILINLYNLVFKPIEKDLTSYGATNIMLYLDGELRNIPFPVLFDGQHFLIQRFHISILTTSSMLNINDAPVQNLKILGMAATKGSKDFRPLDYAKDEIHAIVKDTPHNSNGFIDGKALLDSDFTKPAMFEQLKTASYPLVLITSHFNFALNGESQNFLLMGDESKLTLKEIREADHLFKNVDMLALSACQTAQGSSSGIEIDSFAELAQRSGAKSVVASLWSVNDESTKKLMVAFYRNLNEKRFSSKIEALRQAQLELAGLDDLLQPNSQLKREKTVYASPYYWGPFVMFGNWK